MFDLTEWSVSFGSQNEVYYAVVAVIMGGLIEILPEAQRSKTIFVGLCTDE